MFARRRPLFKTILTTVLLIVLNAMPPSGTRSVAAATSSNLWAPNGTVGALAAVGDTLYVGGSFNYIGPPTGSFAAVQPGNGQVGASLPPVEGKVLVTAPDTNGGWYIGGTFTAVGGAARQGLAHIFSNGTLDTTWAPSVGRYPLTSVEPEVRALAVSQSKVYVGGVFATINDKQRDGLAAFDAATGALLDWAPLAGRVDPTLYNPPTVNALLLSPDASRLYVSGALFPYQPEASIGLKIFRTADDTLQDGWPVTFDQMALSANGAVLYGRVYKTVRALDASTGVEKWSVVAGSDDKTILNGMALSGDTIYVGGVFQQLGGAARTNLGAINAITGEVRPWAPAFDKYVYALAADTVGVYAGTDPRYREYSIGRSKEPRIGKVAAFDPTTGVSLWTSLFGGQDPLINALTTHNGGLFVAGDFYSIGGVERNGVAAIDIRTGTATPWAPELGLLGSVNAIAANEHTVYVGGSFRSPLGSTNNCLSAFDAATGTARDWKPNVDMGYCRVGALLLDGNTLYVGGSFDTIGAQQPQPTRHGLAALDATTAVASEWNSEVLSDDSQTDVQAMVLSGDALYVGGAFYRANTNGFFGLAALDKTTGKASTSFQQAQIELGQYVSALSLNPKSGLLTVGGGFNALGDQQRTNLGQIDLKTNTVTNWNPGPQHIEGTYGPTVRSLAGFGSTVYVGGQFQQVGSSPAQRSNFAALDETTGAVTGTPANSNGVVSELLAHAGKLYIGGGFTTIDGQFRPYLAALALAQNAGAEQPTNITATSATLRGSADVGEGQASASFELSTTSGDYTNARIVPATPATITGTATLSATVTGLVPGTTYFYRLVVTEPSGTTRSAEQQFATPTNPLPPPPSKVFLPLVRKGP